MNRFIYRVSSLTFVAAMVMIVLEGTVWSQQVETREDLDDWLITELSDSEVIRWRMIGNQGASGDSGSPDFPCEGTVRIEVAESREAVESQPLALDFGTCGCRTVIRGIYRHRGEAVAVLAASNGGLSRGGDEFSDNCIVAVALTSPPEILFQRHLVSALSSWWVKFRPHDYKFLPMHDVLLVVMEGADGSLSWPVGEQPETQASMIAATMPLAANEVATMPEDLRSRLAPVSMVGRSGWSVLQEPFTYPPRRMVVGASQLRNRVFSTELSYDGPQLEIKTIHGDDGDVHDPLPSVDFPLADYRWKGLGFGPQPGEGEVESIALGKEQEIHVLRWPCIADPNDWDVMRDYELPRYEEWLVLLDTGDSGKVAARTHLIKTCLTFQALQFFHGRGGHFRSFENGHFEKIIENGRSKGVRIHHSRPRILIPSGPSPLPDEREYFEKSWPNHDWWHPIFEVPNAGTDLVFRIDRGPFVGDGASVPTTR